MVLEVPVRIFIDVSVVQKHFAVLYPSKRVADLALPRPQCLHLGAMQDDSGFERLQDVIISPRFGVAQNIGHKTAPHPRTFEPLPECAYSMNCRGSSPDFQPGSARG